MILCSATSIHVSTKIRPVHLCACVSTDPERCQWVHPAGLPERGGASDSSAAPAHCPLLRRVHRWRATGHGVRVHEARWPEPLSAVSSAPRDAAVNTLVWPALQTSWQPYISNHILNQKRGCFAKTLVELLFIYFLNFYISLLVTTRQHQFICS